MTSRSTSRCRVSSPHRYCRNRKPGRSPTRSSRFQALIGTVETLPPQLLCLWHRRVSSPHRYCRNQVRASSSSSTIRVSSPHRYCRNVQRSADDRLEVRVSSPHRYCRNPGHQGRCPPRSTFQALIGTVETRAVDDIASGLWHVSSPHRYCRNASAPGACSRHTPRFKPS